MKNKISEAFDDIKPTTKQKEIMINNIMTSVHNNKGTKLISKICLGSLIIVLGLTIYKLNFGENKLSNPDIGIMPIRQFNPPTIEYNNECYIQEDKIDNINEKKGQLLLEIEANNLSSKRIVFENKENKNLLILYQDNIYYNLEKCKEKENE